MSEQLPLPVMVPGPDPDLEPYDGDDDELIAAIESGNVQTYIDKYMGVEKRLSAQWGQPGERRKRLVARLKRVRTYNPPVKGGRRRKKFKP